MDCPSSVSFAHALSSLTTTNQQYVLRYLALLEARNYARSTLKAIVGALDYLIRLLPDPRQATLVADLAQITSQDIFDFVCAAQKAGLAPSTINTRLSMLIEFFEFLREDGLIAQQPILRRRHRLLAPATLPKPMSENDLIAFFKVIDSVRDRLMFLLMLRCGLRVSEVCALTWDTIDFNDGTVRINNGKGQVDRIVYLSPDVEQSLKLWQLRQTKSDYLFPGNGPKFTHLCCRTVQWLMTNYLRQAGINVSNKCICIRSKR